MSTPGSPAATLAGASVVSDPVSVRSKPLLSVLDGDRVDPPPVWLMRQAGRYLPEYRALRKEAGGFLDLCLDPEAAAEVTLQPVRRFGFDAAILFADILLVPYGLGQALDYVEGEGPRLDPLAGPADLARLDRGRLLPVLAPVGETVRRVVAGLPPGTALIGFAGAPWTVASYMIGGGKGREAALGWLESDPEGYARLSDLLVDATLEYLLMQIRAGAEVIQIFDSWAGDLPPEHFERFCIAPMRAISDALRARCPEVPVIGFPRGVSLPDYLAYVRGAGVAAVALDERIDPQAAARDLQPRLPVQGNLDPALLEGDSPTLEESVRRVCRAFRGGPHVFNLGHGIRPTASPDNVARLVEAVRRSGAA